jgi:hypothetical protein
MTRIRAGGWSEGIRSASCAVVPLAEREAHEAGRLLGLARTADVVEAAVVTTALRQKAMILTGDRADMERLVRASGRRSRLAAPRPRNGQLSSSGRAIV